MTFIKGDDKRQAIAPLRGYSYQIWQSVFRWIELKENQSLFLEGAEDIDLLGPNAQTETIQVKETAESGSVTLRTQDVVEAINHYWQHQSNNPFLSITFRFLTTSERGFEKPNPFDGRRGMDLWDSCKYPGTDISALKSFLIATSNLSPDLQKFINAATDEEIRQQLILPIEWDTGKGRQSFIEEIVERKVIEHGDRVGNLFPSESKAVIPHLLKKVWDVVIDKENRELTRYDFITLFEEVTMKLISKQRLQELESGRNIFAKSSANFSGIDTQAAVLTGNWGGDAIVEPFSPPNMDKFVKRDQLVDGLKDNLIKFGTIVLTGSTGMGKSLLSYQLAIATEGHWRRIDLRGYTPEQIRDRLVLASNFIEDNPEQIDCIIDDLNFDKQVAVYENALAKLLYILTIRNGRLVITSHNSLPTCISILSNVPKESLFVVPLLEEDEIKDLALKHNCPRGKKLISWSSLVIAHTNGHPLLAHAQIRSLEFNNWRTPVFEDILSNQEVKDVKQEFRGTLRDQLPDEARTLLYRLSIFTGRFNRRQALLMGERKPAVRMVGDNFDLLIGPWIEPVDNTHFRLSPLLIGTALATFTQKEIQALHCAAASSFLGEKSIGFSEVNAMLMHGLLGKNPFPLMVLVPNVLGVEEKYKRAMFEAIRWFGFIKTGENEEIFPSFPLVNHLLRLLQFTMLAELDPTDAIKVARKWEQEIIKQNKSLDLAGFKKRETFQFLSDVILEFRVPFSLTKIADWVLRLITLLQSEEKFYPDHPEAEVEFKAINIHFENITLYVRAAIARCKSRVDIVELLNVFEKSNNTSVVEVWKILDEEIDLSSSLADKIWLDEVNKPVGDWQQCLGMLDWIAGYAKRNGIKTLNAAAFRAKAIIYEEYLKNSNIALQLLSEGEISVGYAHPFLLEYRARIFLFNKQYAEALEELRGILNIYEKENFSGRFLTYRDAGICAAKIDKWNEAARFALKGKESLEQPWLNSGFEPTKENRVLVVTYQTEYAFALWKAGEKVTSVKEFAKILNSFQKLPKLEDDLRTHQLYKRFAHAVVWMLDTEIKTETTFFEPPPGWFTNFELSEEIKDQPINPPERVWFLLSALELKLNIGDDIFKHFYDLHKNNQNPEIKIGVEGFRLQHALRNSEFEDIVSIFLDHSQFVIENIATVNPNGQIWQEENFLKQITFTAIAILLSQRKRELIPLEKWREDTFKQKTVNEEVSSWYYVIEESLNLKESELYEILKNADALPERRVLAALILSSFENVDANSRFYANIVLLTSNFIQGWKDEMEDAIERLIVEKWRNVAQKQRFSLLSPKISTVSIIAACNDDSCRGIRKAAKVLLSANSAVGIKIHPNILEHLTHLSKI